MFSLHPRHCYCIQGSVNKIHDSDVVVPTTTVLSISASTLNTDLSLYTVGCSDTVRTARVRYDSASNLRGLNV